MPDFIESTNKKTTIYIPTSTKESSICNVNEHVKCVFDDFQMACKERNWDRVFEFVGGVYCYGRILDLTIANAFSKNTFDDMKLVLQGYWGLRGGKEVIFRLIKYGENLTSHNDFRSSFIKKMKKFDAELSDDIEVDEILKNKMIFGIKYISRRVPGGKYQDYQYDRLEKTMEQFINLNISLQRYHMLDIIEDIKEYDPYIPESKLVITTKFIPHFDNQKIHKLLREQFETIYTNLGGKKLIIT